MLDKLHTTAPMPVRLYVELAVLLRRLWLFHSILIDWTPLCSVVRWAVEICWVGGEVSIWRVTLCVVVRWAAETGWIVGVCGSGRKWHKLAPGVLRVRRLPSATRWSDLLLLPRGRRLRRPPRLLRATSRRDAQAEMCRLRRGDSVFVIVISFFSFSYIRFLTLP